jgi:hypothetical protein
VNEILAMGDVFQFETISYRGLQRQYGGSLRRRVPEKFMALLKRKAERAGAAINAYDPRKSPFAVVPSLWKGEDEALVPTRTCPLQLRTERESEPIACDSGSGNVRDA